LARDCVVGAGVTTTPFVSPRSVPLRPSRSAQRGARHHSDLGAEAVSGSTIAWNMGSSIGRGTFGAEEDGHGAWNTIPIESPDRGARVAGREPPRSVGIPKRSHPLREAQWPQGGRSRRFQRTAWSPLMEVADGDRVKTCAFRVLPARAIALDARRRGRNLGSDPPSRLERDVPVGFELQLERHGHAFNWRDSERGTK